MKTEIALTLFTIGIPLLIISSIIAFIKALNDPDVDKLSLYFGLYIFKYPILLLTIFIGLVFVFIGIFLLN